MNYCPKCGAQVKDGQKFCPKCGHKLITKEPVNLNNESDNADQTDKQRKPIMPEENKEEKSLQVVENEKSTPVVEKEQVAVNSVDFPDKSVLTDDTVPRRKIPKAFVIVICIVSVILAGLFYAGYSLTRPEKTVSRFEKDVAASNRSDLSKVLYCFDSRISVSSKNVDPMLLYFKNNPDYLNKVVQDLKSQQMGSKSSSQFTFQEVGKKFLLFPDYRVVIKPSFIEVSTSIKNVQLMLNNKEIGKSDTDNYSKEFGPYIPGQYSLVANYKGNYVNISEPTAVDLVKLSDGKASVKVLENLKYVYINCDYQDAEVFVDGKDTGVKAGSAQNFGPLKSGSKIYAVATKDGQKLKSNVYNVGDEEGNEVYLDFNQSENDLDNTESQLKDLIGAYINNFTQAVNTGDFSIVQPYIYPDSKLYKMQASYVPSTYKKQITENNQSYNVVSYTVSDDKKSGTICTSEVYDINSNGDSSVKTFNYKYTFQYNDKTGSYQLSDIQANS